MRSKRLIKTGIVFLLLTAGALTLLFARDGHFFGNKAVRPEEIDQPAEEGAREDIGDPTGDDPWQEMDKLVIAYYNKEGISFSGTIKLIDDNGDKEKIMEEYPFEYNAINGEFHYSLGKMEFVYKKDLLLVVDHNNKFISMSAGSIPAGRPDSFFDITAFKKLMEERKANAAVTQSGNEKMLTIDNIEDPQINGYRIYYDPGTYHITKVLVGMLRLSPLDKGEEDGIEEIIAEKETEADNENSSGKEEDEDEDDVEIPAYTYYVEMVYEGTKVLGIRPKDFHPETRFISMMGKETRLSVAYKDYQLLNGAEVQNNIPADSEEQ